MIRAMLGKPQFSAEFIHLKSDLFADVVLNFMSQCRSWAHCGSAWNNRMSLEVNFSTFHETLRGMLVDFSPTSTEK